MSLTENIESLERVIARDDTILDSMSLRARGSCCASCRFGRAFTDLADKQERREAWLLILKQKHEIKSSTVE